MFPVVHKGAGTAAGISKAFLEIHPAGSLAGAIYGKDCFNEELSWIQRGIALLGSIPLVGTFFKGEKILSRVIRLKRDIALLGGGILRKDTEIRNLVVIAEGSGINEVSRLIDQYGGLRKNWKKMKGSGIATDPETGRRAIVEVHWYECHGIGKVEMKNKAIRQWLND